jgi:large subunit ribosomal protein L30
MAEQSSRDVVDQTQSGGEPSPSDVPASINDNQPAGGDLGVTKHIATTTATETNLQSSEIDRADETTSTGASPVEGTGDDKDVGPAAMVSLRGW